MKRLTGIIIHRTNEGERVSVLYSEIDENGTFISTNQRDGFVAVDETLLGHIEALEKFVERRLNP